MEMRQKGIGSRKNSKRLMVGLLGVSALTAGVVAPMGVEAAVEGQWTYTDAVDGGVSITAYSGAGGAVVIPDTIGGKPVTAIGASQIFYNKGLTSIKIPDTVTSIAERTFYRNNITTVKLPSGLKTLGDSAFEGTKLTGVILPGSLTEIGNRVFFGNNIAGVVIPAGVTKIGESAFSGNQLVTLTLEKGVTTLGSYAFSQNNLTGVVIPEGVVTVGEGVFFQNKLTNVTLPRSLTVIGDSMFLSNSITGITIPDTVTSIGKSAFQTNKITEITLPKGIKTIGQTAFSDNQLTGVKVPEGVTTIGLAAFGDNKLVSATIPGSVTTIGAQAFVRNQVVAKNLTIYGEDPSAAKTHALANGYTFNIKVPDPVVPDLTPGAGDSQTATLNLEGGDLTLETSEIKDFGSIKLKNQPQTVTTGFDDKFTVTDNRGTGLGWRLDVSATQFSEVVPAGGFAGGAPTGFTLPIGSLMINGLDTLERTEGTPGGNPSIAGLSNTVIDGSSLATVSNAGQNEGAGKFALTFGEDALSLVVDSSTAKVDTLNYPTGATPYESTVTWDLVSAP